jgi:hypothetical protein
MYEDGDTTLLYCENCGAINGETYRGWLQRTATYVKTSISKELLDTVFFVDYTNKHLYLCQFCKELRHPRFHFHYKTGALHGHK